MIGQKDSHAYLLADKDCLMGMRFSQTRELHWTEWLAGFASCIQTIECS